MSKDAKSYEEAQEVLEALSGNRVTTNNIGYGLERVNVAYFDSSRLCIAYYDEVYNVLSII